MFVLRFGLMLGVLLGAFLTASAEEKKDDPKGKAEKNFTTKSKEHKSAVTVDFETELGLNFESLAQLGSRIERSRRAPDPVGLACAANELAVAEKVSGKKASVSSGELYKEAIEIAKTRRDSSELKAVALLVKDEATSKDLEALAKKAHLQEEKARKAAKSGEKPRGVRWLTVHNNTGNRLQVYEDNRHLGWVAPFGNFRFYVGHGANFNSVLSARSGGRTWGPRVIDETFEQYNWYLN